MNFSSARRSFKPGFEAPTCIFEFGGPEIGNANVDGINELTRCIVNSPHTRIPCAYDHSLVLILDREPPFQRTGSFKRVSGAGRERVLVSPWFEYHQLGLRRCIADRDSRDSFG